MSIIGASAAESSARRILFGLGFTVEMQVHCVVIDCVVVSVLTVLLLMIPLCVFDTAGSSHEVLLWWLANENFPSSSTLHCPYPLDVG